MSSNFSANQYDNAFKSTKLQNWTVPKHHKEKPSPAEGHTIFIATDRGHLLPGMKRGCPWTSFQGTWDFPSRIPPVHINPTARSQEGQQRLRAWGQIQHQVPSATGKLNETNEYSRTPQCEGTISDPQQEGFSVSNPPRDEPELGRTTSQAQSRPATQESQVQSRPTTRQSQLQSRPSTRQSQVQSRPSTRQSPVQSSPSTRQSPVQSRPETRQSPVRSRPETQLSRVRSRPETQLSHADSQPVSKQSQAKSRPLTQASQT